MNKIYSEMCTVYDEAFLPNCKIRSEVVEFSRDYPFVSISFFHMMDGYACLGVSPRHYLFMPEIMVLFENDTNVPWSERTGLYQIMSRGSPVFEGQKNYFIAWFTLNNPTAESDSLETIRFLFTAFLNQLRKLNPNPKDHNEFDIAEYRLDNALETYFKEVQLELSPVGGNENEYVPINGFECITDDEKKMEKAVLECDIGTLQDLLQNKRVTSDKLIDKSPPWLCSIFKVHSKEERIKHLEMVDLLLAYKADLMMVTLENRSALESAVNATESAGSLGFAQSYEFCKDLIWRFLVLENDASNLIVPSKMFNTSIGEFIVSGQKTIYKMRNIPTKLKRISLADNDGIMCLTANNETKIQVKSFLTSTLPGTVRKRLLQLFLENFLWSKEMSLIGKELYFNEILKETDSPVWVDLICFQAQNDIVGFTVTTAMRMVHKGAEIILHHARLAVADRQLSEYGRLTSMILFHRGFVLRALNPSKEVYTVYEAATVFGFRITDYLEFYPKYRCIDELLLFAILDRIYPNNTKRCHDRNIYIEDPLACDVKSNSKSMWGKSFNDISSEMFRNRFFQNGESLLMVFRNDLANLANMCLSYDLSLAKQIFDKLVEMMTPYHERVGTYLALKAKL